MLRIIEIGSVRTYGGKFHLAYTYAREDGVKRFAVACSCKGTGNGRMQQGVFLVGQRPTCKPSLKILANDASPISQAYKELVK